MNVKSSLLEPAEVKSTHNSVSRSLIATLTEARPEPPLSAADPLKDVPNCKVVSWLAGDVISVVGASVSVLFDSNPSELPSICTSNLLIDIM